MSTISKLDLNNTNGPKYKAVLAWLKDQIISGELKAGEKLPPVRDLAWELGVTPGTVARAYKEAISENLLEATVGRGTFVSAPSVPKTESTKGLYIEEPSGKINLRNTNTTDVGQFVQIAAAMQDVAKTRTRSYVNYPGFEGRSAIYPELVKWMEYVQVVADPGNIVVTHGGQNAIAIALQVILGRKLGGVAIDAMSYPGIRYAVQAQNGTLFGIEMDEQGMLPKALEEACRKNNIKALFTSANVVNPTTGTMSYERRDALAVIARKYDLQVIEDDCWGIGPAVCPGFLSLCPERAWYISSFTKVVTSGLRFGWLVCPKARAREAQRVMRINSFGVSRAVVDIAFQLLISGDAIDVRRRVLDSVEKRVELTVNLLGKWNLKYRRDVPFVWLELPTGWRASSFVMACEREKIVVRGADEYALKGASVPDAVRISVNGNIPEESYTKALLKISELLSSPPMEAGELS